MGTDPAAEVEREAAELLRRLDLLTTGLGGLDDEPPRARATPAELIARVQRQRERVAELRRAVAAARTSADDLVAAARAETDKASCARIERREWPDGTGASTVATPRTAPRRTHVALSRAIAFVDAHAREPVTVEDIAVAACVSERHLQGLFRRDHGVTPMGYLRHVRLDGAHDDLAAADSTSGTTVAVIARSWLFTHLGRFAADYRDRFGCTPSRTLRADPDRAGPTRLPAAGR